MKAVQISKTGGPEVLEINEITLGKPGADEVTIEHIANAFSTEFQKYCIWKESQENLND